MWPRSRMVLLWCAALASMAVVGTQSAAISWMAWTWVGASTVAAIVGTVLFYVDRAERRRSGYPYP